MATEDHDFAEINYFSFKKNLDGTGKAQVLLGAYQLTAYLNCLKFTHKLGSKHQCHCYKKCFLKPI
jgi:hypothetical protein